MLLKNKWFWIFTFILIFILSQDFYSWDWPVRLGLGGLPTWIWWFFFLQILIVAALYLFAKHFWNKDN